MTAERLQQEIDTMKDERTFIMIYGRMDADSRFPDFWKIDHILDRYYTVSGPDFTVFGQVVKAEMKEEGFVSLELEDDEGRLIGRCYIKNVYEINVNRFTENTAEASA